jgi:8-amino-7-oxononanoate synthase
LDDWLQSSLAERQSKNLFRELKTTEGLIDFCSNDYLGLARSQVLLELISERCNEIGSLNGSTGSRLISGNFKHTEEVESMLASIFKSEAALIFNSGYSANLAIFSSLPQKGDTLLLDELVHASIKDGARLSFANRFTFRHNDVNDLESKLKRATGRKFIAVESVYSMDGDECPLTDIVKLARKYDAYILLDEAHSTGVVGAGGGGIAHALGLEEDIHVRVFTFGKAMGIHGACVAGSKALREYLINFARPFIYTTAPPPHSIISVEMAFKFLSENISLQASLGENIKFFLKGVRDMPNRTASESAIQTIICPGNDNVRESADKLQRAGFDVRPIVSPTVAAGAERLRVCLHAFNTHAEIERLCFELKSSSVLSNR